MTLAVGLSLVLRLGYVLGMRQTPVVWDSEIYDRAGQAVARWMGPQLPSLLWAAFTWHPDVLKAFAGDLSSWIMVKGPTYPLFLGVVYLVFGHSVVIARIAQAVVDSGTTLLTGILGRRIGSRSAGTAAAALHAVYVPAILMTGRLMQETVIIFLLALALTLIVREAESSSGTRMGRLLVAGALVGAILVGRAAMQYLFVFLFPAFWIARQAPRALKRRELLGMGLAMVLVVAPVVALQTVLTGRTSINSALSAKADRDLLFGLHPASRGWEPDLSDPEGAGGPPEALRAPGVPEGATFRTAVVGYVRTHPLAPVAAAVRKAYRFYAYPCADWLEEYLLSPGAVGILHRGIVLLGLLGCACSLDRWRAALPLASAALYVLGIASLAQTEVRYVLPAIVAWIPLAGAGLTCLTAGVVERVRRGARGWGLPAALLGGVAILASPLLEVPALLARVPAIGPGAAFWLSQGLSLLLLVLLLPVLNLLLGGTRAPRGRPIALGALGALVATVALAHATEDGGTWRVWKASLDSPAMRIRQTFHVPDAPERLTGARLFVDVRPDVSGDEVVRVRAGDGETFSLGGKEVGGECFSAYRAEAAGRWQGAYDLMESRYSLKTERIRKWMVVPLLTLPAAGKDFEVDLDLPRGGRLDVFGDYLPQGKSAFFEGPSFDVCRNSLSTSFCKFLNDGEYRISERTPLRGTVSGGWARGDAWVQHDLSPDPGLQLGRYRIFLVLTGERGGLFVL